MFTRVTPKFRAPPAIGQAVVESKRVPSASTTQRAFSSAYSLDTLSSPALRWPTPPEGARALDKLGVVKAAALREGVAGFESGVRRLTVACRLEGEAGDAGKGALQGLSRDEHIGLALTVLQAGRHVGAPLETPTVLSLMFRVLASVPPQPLRLAALRQSADTLADQVLASSPMLSQSQAWFDRPSAERAQALRATFREVRDFARTHDLAPGEPQHQSLQLASDVSPLGARFRTSERGDGLLELSTDLTEMNRQQFEHAYAGTAADPELPAALAISLMLHELLHAWQHAQADRIEAPGQPLPTPAQWSQGLTCALSLATKHGIQAQGLATQAEGVELLSHLADEREAWALQLLFVRAMIRSPHVPHGVKSALRDFLAHTFRQLGPLVGVATEPRALEASGLYWSASGELLAAEPDIAPAVRKARVEEFEGD